MEWTKKDMDEILTSVNKRFDDIENRLVLQNQKLIKINNQLESIIKLRERMDKEK